MDIICSKINEGEDNLMYSLDFSSDQQEGTTIIHALAYNFPYTAPILSR